MTIHYGKRNLGAGTAASPGDTLYIPLQFFNDSGASISIAGTLAVTDIEIFKNGSVTQRATDSGYAILGDTGNFDNRTGFKGISISLFNTSDDATFYANGATYWVAIDSVTVDARTVRFFAAVFEIGEPRANIVAVLGDTGAAHLDQGRYGVISDTGRQAAVLDTGKVAAAVWTSHATRTLTAFALDTGIRDTIWRASPSAYTSDTGSFGYAAGRLMAVRNDTGAAHLDAGRLGVSATATLDTGAVNRAVWNADASRTLTAFAFDTGIRDMIWRASPSSYTSDTGSFGYAAGRLLAVRNDTGAAHLDQGRLGVLADSGVLAAVLDTGKVAAAVWTSHQTRTLTAFALDTGVRDTIWRASPSSYTSDTGSFGYTAGRVMAVRNDTGAAHLDQGRFGVISDSGRMAAVLDTGKVAAAVWTSHATRTLTAFAFDTGVADTVWKSSTSSFTADTGSVGYAQGRLMAVKGDTGAAHLDQGRLGVIADSGHIQGSIDTGKVSNAVWDTLRANHTAAGSFGRDLLDSGMAGLVLDTGKVASAVWTSHATRTLTAFALDTGIAQTVWREHNSSYTDTGTFGWGVNVHKLDNDTGAATHLAQAFAAQNTNSDTGLIANAAAIRTQADKLTFDTGNELRVDVRKVNNIGVVGAGSGNDKWRPE